MGCSKGFRFRGKKNIPVGEQRTFLSASKDTIRGGEEGKGKGAGARHMKGPSLKERNLLKSRGKRILSRKTFNGL